MGATSNEAEFEGGLWHDCHIWSLEFRMIEPAEGLWNDDLVLYLDFIVQWLCDESGRCRFRVAPAALVFHDVREFSMQIDEEHTGSGLQEPVISTIERTRIPAVDHTAAPRYRWNIPFSWPAGHLAFSASGYSQRLLGDPIETEDQRLTRGQRQQMLTPPKG